MRKSWEGENFIRHIAIRFPVTFTTGHFPLDTARFGVITAPFGSWLKLYYLYVGGSGIGFSIHYFLRSLALSFTLDIYTHKRIYHLFPHFPATFPYHLPATRFLLRFSSNTFIV